VDCPNEASIPFDADDPLFSTSAEQEIPMIVIVFRSRTRDDANMPEMDAMGQRMYDLASGMSGFLTYKDYTAADGENVTLVEFASEAELLAWRHHPEHAAGQERGRREFFSSYQIQVCKVERAYGFSQAEGRREHQP
jgi:heme-degrading monooxygenase HmoA